MSDPSVVADKPDTSVPENSIRNGLVFWGFWPAAVMVLAQWEAARLVAVAFPAKILVLTLTGTLAVYGLDRWVERRNQLFTSARHHGNRKTNLAIAILIGAVFLFTLPGLSQRHWLWLIMLAALGLVYLAVTAAYLRPFPASKELIGSLCFTVLVWGWFNHFELVLVVPFYLIGVANFFISSHQDRVRDRHNQMRSLALVAPRLNTVAFRCCSFAACLLLCVTAGFASPLPWVALAHGLWPCGSRHSIDWAFLPLLVRPLLWLWGYILP